MRRPRTSVPALLLALVLLALTPLAHASPPDQTWLAGLYDDADYDDVVLLVASIAVAFTEAGPPPPPRFVIVAAVPSPALVSLPLAPPLATASRAPPSA
jgi:hypothetical protein